MKNLLVPILCTAAIGSAFGDIQQDQWQVAPSPQQDPADPSSLPAASVSDIAGPDPGGAVAAMLAVHPRYVDGIVVVTGRKGQPDPPEWIVIARDDEDLGTLHQITVADGQVIAERLSLNAYESFRQDVAINPVAVQVDSSDAFQIAIPIGAANNKIISHVDYALTVRGSDATPIWTLHCFDVKGSYIGQITLLASNGHILSKSGFPKNPPVP